MVIALAASSGNKNGYMHTHAHARVDTHKAQTFPAVHTNTLAYQHAQFDFTCVASHCTQLEKVHAHAPPTHILVLLSL